jgi:hypothetical protein
MGAAVVGRALIARIIERVNVAQMEVSFIVPVFFLNFAFVSIDTGIEWGLKRGLAPDFRVFFEMLKFEDLNSSCVPIMLNAK